MIFASYAQFYAKGRRSFYIGCFDFYAEAGRGGEQLAVDWRIGKSALTAVSSDASWLLISLSVLLTNKILVGRLVGKLVAHLKFFNSKNI